PLAHLFFEGLAVQCFPFRRALRQRAGIGGQSPADEGVHLVAHTKFGRQDTLDLAQDRHLLHLEPRGGGVLEVVQDQVREMRHLLVAQDHQRIAPFSFTSCFLIIWKSCCSFIWPRAISDSYVRINSLASALMRSSTLSSSTITRSSDTVRTRRSATSSIIPPAISFATSWLA